MDKGHTVAPDDDCNIRSDDCNIRSDDCNIRSDDCNIRSDDRWMRRAVAEAELARSRDEVPVGAVVVRDGTVLGSAGNTMVGRQDPTAHAEMQAIRQASSATGSQRLVGADLYVTLEPCAMCAGALVLARIERVVFGAYDPKAGACGTLRNVVQDHRLNHWCVVVGGVLEEECADLLRSFFARLRGGGKDRGVQPDGSHE